VKFILWLVLGMALGPTILAIKPPEWYASLSQIAGGVFLFLAGWEMRFLNLKEDRKFYALLFIGSFLVPVIAGWFFFNGNIFMAMAMGISALPVAIQILKEKGLYNTILARRAITLSSLCDLGAWIALAYVLPAANVGSWILSHWIVMAFFGGLVLGRFVEMPRTPLALAFQMWVLAPLFFVGLGWKIDLWALFDLKIFLEVFLLAVATKSVGVYFFSRWAGESHKDSWDLAAILNARGAMEILAASYAYQASLIDGGSFSALVLLGVFSSVMAVPLIKK
jgi:Kef-type K+ transport system membrane component KefB